MKKSITRALSIGAVIVASSFGLAACSPSTPAPSAAPVDPSDPLADLVTAAQQEGTLTLYTSQSPGIVEVLVPLFEAEYGITVDLLRLNSGELQQRLTAEGTSSPADLAELPAEFFTSSGAMFSDLSVDAVPALADIPEAYVSEKYVAASAVPFVIGYNTDIVPKADVPKTWEDVVSDFSGQFLLTDPQSSNGYMAFLAEMQDAFGDDFIKDLGSNSAQLAAGGAAAAQQIAAGEFAITIPNYPGQLTPLMAQGATIDYVLPQEPAIALPMNVGVLEKATHPNAAHLYLNWLLSHDGQEALCSTGLGGTVLTEATDLKGCAEMPDGWRPYALGIDDDRRNELLDLLGK